MVILSKENAILILLIVQMIIMLILYHIYALNQLIVKLSQQNIILHKILQKHVLINVYHLIMEIVYYGHVLQYATKHLLVKIQQENVFLVVQVMDHLLKLN
jgi:hypothetical protein